MRSVPRIDGDLHGRLPSIPGNPPPLWELPPGCPFRPRCTFAFGRCEEEDPPLEPVGGRGQRAACWASVREVVR
jgi:oligopeptide/dipeptide ABC transporter ATP-binding protein